MNYDDYYARQVGGALPYFTGARVQRGHGFGSLFSGLLRTVAPLIKRGAVALGKRALATGAQIAGDVVAGKNVKKAAKRRATAAGRNLMQSEDTSEAYKTNRTPSACHSHQTTTANRRVFVIWRSYTDNRVRE